jgi:hypothetical protein
VALPLFEQNAGRDQQQGKRQIGAPTMRLGLILIVFEQVSHAVAGFLPWFRFAARYTPVGLLLQT